MVGFVILLIIVAGACAYFAYRNPDFKARAMAFVAAVAAFAAAFWEQLSSLWS